MLAATLQKQQAAAVSPSKWWTVAPMLAVGFLSMASASTEGGLVGLVHHPRLLGALAWVRRLQPIKGLACRF